MSVLKPPAPIRPGENVTIEGLGPTDPEHAEMTARNGGRVPRETHLEPLKIEPYESSFARLGFMRGLWK